MERKEFRDLATPTEAKEAIATLDISTSTEHIPIQQAVGRVLAERIDASIDVPGFNRASMDGYAVRARDTFGADEASPQKLTLIGSVHAGSAPEIAIQAGETVEISTGAVMPEGSDAVVMVERTDQQSDVINIRSAVAPGDHVMVAGADIAAGERALGPNTQLTAREIGLLAALGYETVPVYGRPQVGIVSTGDELVRPGQEIHHQKGQIYDVNSYSIAAAVEAAGGEVELYPHAGDEYEELESILRTAAAECDLVLSSGSTSASAVDIIYKVIESEGDLLIHGVAVKPGKPMLIGRLGGSAYIGLPGYPVSALTIFRAFVAPAIRSAAELPKLQTTSISGTMLVQERYQEGRLRYLPVGLTTDDRNNTLVYPVDKGSGATTSLVEADGIISVPPSINYLEKGESVDVRLFSPSIRPPSVLGAGEDDPVLARMLDRIPRPRYLGGGTRPGIRMVRDEIADFAVVTDGFNSSEWKSLGVEEYGSWQREWGLLLEPGNPKEITDITDLLSSDLRFVNRTTDSGLRETFDSTLARAVKTNGIDQPELIDAFTRDSIEVRAHESPANHIRNGNAAVGLGLNATAAAHNLDFLSLGHETVKVLVRTDRMPKNGVQTLLTQFDNLSSIIAQLEGFRII